MKRFAGIMAVCLVAATSVAFAADEIKSGLPVGETVPAFNVRDITGPNEGKTLCYRCKYGARPVVTIFTRELNENVSALVKEIDSVVGKNSEAKMAAFVVLVSDDAEKLEPQLKTLAKVGEIKNTPLTTIEGVTGPPNYNLSKDAEVTVMMWTESTVKVNHAYGKGKLDKKAIKELVAETKKILE